MVYSNVNMCAFEAHS